MKKVFIVCGLGYGDEGKGTTTHYLTARHRAHTVVRTGGPQAFHRVVTASGLEHVFSQFGSGTLSGARTHLSEHMVIDPDAILNEGMTLRYARGVQNPFDYITVHEDALVITPFHGIANRLHELARGDAKHGTVGIGVGETVLDEEAHAHHTLRAKDLTRNDLAEMLEAVRLRKISELAESIARIETLSDAVRSAATRDIAELSTSETTQWAVERFGLMALTVPIVDTTYVAEKVLGIDGTVVFEGSQGVLLDRFCGFHPHTTKVRATPAPALSLVESCEYDGDVTVLGVTRAYHTRHGAGPFVSESAELTSALPDSYNGDHRWQGKFRVGSLDLIALRYALAVSGGSDVFDGVVLTCVDRIHELGAWNVCTSYEGGDGQYIFGEEIAAHPSEASSLEVLRHQENLALGLSVCRPVVRRFEIPSSASPEDLVPACAGILNDALPVPVRIVSLGQTEKDKFEL